MVVSPESEGASLGMGLVLTILLGSLVLGDLEQQGEHRVRLSEGVKNRLIKASGSARAVTQVKLHVVDGSSGLRGLRNVWAKSYG